MVRRSRRGFTLVELLTVIGILLLLLGIGTLGYMHVDKVAAERATRTRLDICSSILNEYETAGVSITAIDTAARTGGIYAANPGDVNMGSGSRTGAAVVATATALQSFSHVPAVKLTLSQLPASALLTNQTPPFIVIVDGWKNPIIYVPSGGLYRVTLTQGNSKVLKIVTSVDGRPFWASAGQDGDFLAGDDNIYSTAVVYH